MEHTKHIIRAVLLLVVIAVVFVFARHFAIPKSFGEHGHYRYDSVEEYRAPTPRHGGPVGCAECHEEEAGARAEGKHNTVSCEVCHDVLATHVIDDETVGEMHVDRTYELCGRCHEHLVARPKTFPQIVIPHHVIEQGGEMSESVCLECHNAHNPSESE